MEFIMDGFFQICNLMPKELVFDKKKTFNNPKKFILRLIKIPRFYKKKVRTYNF